MADHEFDPHSCINCCPGGDCKHEHLWCAECRDRCCNLFAEEDNERYCWLCHRVGPEEEFAEFDTVEALDNTMVVVTYFKCKDGCPA